MPFDTVADQYRREMARKTGRELVAACGRHNNYTPDQIIAALRRLGYPAEMDLWALGLFASPREFERHYAARGERHDYFAVNDRMVASLEHEGLRTRQPNGVSRKASGNGWVEMPTADFSGIDLSQFDWHHFDWHIPH